jgi:hypothetical protein
MYYRLGIGQRHTDMRQEKNKHVEVIGVVLPWIFTSDHIAGFVAWALIADIKLNDDCKDLNDDER